MGSLVSLPELEAARFSSLVLTCSDGRLHGRSNLDVLVGKVLGAGVYDLIAIPGGCWRMIHGRLEEQRQLRDDIELLISKHQPETLLVVSHNQCARYANSPGFSSSNEEKIIREDLSRAVALLGALFRRLTVIPAIARVDRRRTIGLEVLTTDGAGRVLDIKNDPLYSV